MTGKPRKPHNFSHNGDPLTATSLGDSRAWGDANEHVKFEVQKEIVQQAGKANLSQKDTANLLALAEVESGFNPDAATTSRKSSASGVFAITDSTAKDTAERLSGSKRIGGYEVAGTYDRFNTASNVSYGIAVYLDKKKVAGSDDVGDIYKAWNTNPAEYNKLLTRLDKHATQYEKDLTNKVWDGPGPAAPPDKASKPAATDTPAKTGPAAIKPMTEPPKTVADILSALSALKAPTSEGATVLGPLTGSDSPSSRVLNRAQEPVVKTANKPL
ncbi:transglycosylase SLT domain-containing protein [Undibacterium sp. TS12]|uniref:transglycosylase SLT domain-containing protein n=1 Tax=Undibacterium sp. TS12 TaxID=2908202 RepID=UPI001F4C845C|nr:transglycosylase SLT domain-containing protein [Undibacterium sp. TS12]MCH8622278.1 transglycosylase SLT domain-containing protein [Undibacterium sp. TS12]